MMKWSMGAAVAALLIYSCQPVAAEQVATIQGTITFMYETGELESLHSDDLFATHAECYQAGREAVLKFLPNFPLVIGHIIVCEPVGVDI